MRRSELRSASALGLALCLFGCQKAPTEKRAVAASNPCGAGRAAKPADGSAALVGAEIPPGPAWQPSAECESVAQNLLVDLSLDEKIGQMTQPERRDVSAEDVTRYLLGSVLSGGGSYPGDGSPTAWANMTDALHLGALLTPHRIPLLYGADAVHGHGNVFGAVIFPHNVGLGASGDVELVGRAARITALEMRGTGVDWTFSPVMAAPRDERWGRTYEGFGEEPGLVALLGSAAIRGYQGARLGDPYSVLATAKHFAGDGATRCGSAPRPDFGPPPLLDRGDVTLDEPTFRRLAVDQYRFAIAAGAGSIMVSYSSYRGTKLHGERRLLTEVLKGELGFRGFVVSDYFGIHDLPGTYQEQVTTGVNAGIDLFMEGKHWLAFIDALRSAVTRRAVPMSRVDDAVTRILRVKCELGLFGPGYTGQADRRLTAEVGSSEHRAEARDAVRRTLVVLKNEGLLPLAKQGRIHVAGSAADDLDRQCGGWTMSWQGMGSATVGTTILTAIRNSVGGLGDVTYSLDGSGAAGANVGIAVIGERPYAEGFGDRRDLALSPGDQATLGTMAATGIPLVVVLVSGRPLIIEPHLVQARAWVAAWLPGSEGDGVADVLFGEVAPTARLPHSWPARMDQIPINVGDPDYASDPPLFPFGYGLGHP
jgi:beta-glucosidase